MNEEQKALFTEYEELKREIAELEDRCEELKPMLIELIPEDTNVDTGTGIFMLMKRKLWKYSDETTNRELVLKEIKKIEEQTGVAEAVDGPIFITFKPKKS